MGIFQLGNFVFSSGRKSPYKVEIDKASDEDIETLTLMGLDKVGPFCEVRPVPKGKSGSPIDNAERIAKVLRPLANPANRLLPILIVDDVLTSGDSITKMKQLIESERRQDVMGLVLFAWAIPPSWVESVWIDGSMQPILLRPAEGLTAAPN